MNATLNNRFGQNESQEADKHGKRKCILVYIGEQVMYHLDSDENESMISSNEELKSQSQPPSVRRNIGSEFEHSSTLCTMRKRKTFLKHKPAFRTDKKKEETW